MPLYSLAEAAAYVGLPPATLRSWVVGRQYPRRGGRAFFRPLIHPADSRANRLSFTNLVEAYVLSALRHKHGVSIADVRTALEYAQGQLHIPRLLISPDLRAHAGELFIERYGQLISLSVAGQYALRQILHRYLERVVWDEDNIPGRLYPFTSRTPHADVQVVVINPRVSFGRPIIAAKGIRTEVITDRIDAGEAPEEVAADYGLTDDELNEAVLHHAA